MPRSTLMESYLSDTVRRRIINNPPSCHPRLDDCFRSDLLLDWDRVNDCMGDIAQLGWKDVQTTTTGSEDEFYTDKTQRLWFLINSAGKVWKEARPEVITSLIQRFKWMKREPDELKRLAGGYDSEANAFEVILKLTSFLERGLGDVYLIKNCPVPFLLRDLLHSAELETIIGKIPVRLLNVTMGHVLGLNLRNVAWHGFLSDDELNCSLVPFLIIVSATIGKDLTNVSINNRPKRETMVEMSSLLDDFFTDLAVAMEAKNEVIDRCPHVPRGQLSFWCHAFELFDLSLYEDSLVVLLPLLEHMLRSIYREANNCSDDILKATTTEFYIIMDDLLEINVKGKVNGLVSRLGTNVFEALIDVFTATNGPRLRDRISHGEIRLNDVPFRMTAHILGLSLYVADSTGAKKLADPASIEPKFHDKAILKRQLTETARYLQNWDSSSLDLDLEWDTEEVESVISLTGQSGLSRLLDDSFRIITAVKINTLTRQTHDVDSLMTSIAVNIHKAALTTWDNVATRTFQFKNKQMRSRSRTNYLLMLNVLPIFRSTIALLIFILARFFSSILSSPSTNLQKHLRVFLKFAENAKTMCALDKNRWLEIKRSCMELSNFMRSSPFLHLIQKSVA